MTSKYKVLFIIAICVILLESVVIIYDLCKRNFYSHYCYLDYNGDLGTSFFCRRNQCSSSTMEAIDVITYINLKHN